MVFELAVAGGTLFLILILSRVAGFLGLLDHPNNTTKRHDSPTPVVGGVVIVCIVVIVLLISDRPPKLDLLLLGTACVALLGVFDDSVGLPIWTRLVFQIGVGMSMALGAGVLVENLGPVASYEFAVPEKMQIFLTVAFVVFAMNAINMSDGIDGNAAGLVLVGLGLIAVGQLLTVGEIRRPSWLTALIISVAVFWAVNVSLTPARKVFLGDAGTLSLGFILSWLCVDFSQGPGRSIHPVMVGWVLLIPASDFVGVVTIRLLSGRSPTTGDRDHLHHILADTSEQNNRKALFVILGLAAVLGWVGIFLTSLDPAFGLMALICVITLSTSLHVRYVLRK